MGRQENFTADRIAAFRCEPGKQQTIYFDGKTSGLGLRVTTTGAKSYIFETRLHGKTIRLTIGGPDTWPLETQWRTDKTTGEKVEFQRGARQEAARLKSLTDQGIDPRALERAKQDALASAAAALEGAKKYTLGKLHDAYCDYLEAAGKKKSARSARSLFKTHVSDELKNAPAKNVTAESIADMLRKVTEKGKTRSAGAIRTSLLAAYNVGLHARLDPTLPVSFKAFDISANPIASIRAITSNAGNRVLTNDELRLYLSGLDTRPADVALWVALLSGGQRMEQLLRATVADWEPETKTLRLFDSKGRRKEPRIHFLPLAPRAAALVKSLADAAGEDKQLFHTDPTAPGKRVKAICADKGIDPAFDLRDLRRTVETRMAGLGISKDTRAQVLSHGLGGVQDKHYDRHTYENEKRNALVTWEKWLTAVEKDEKAAPNVVPMERKTAA